MKIVIKQIKMKTQGSCHISDILLTGDQELLTKDIYAIAYTRPDSSGYFYLKNNTGAETHKQNFCFLTLMAPDLVGVLIP